MTVETEHSRKYEAIKAEFPGIVTKQFECDTGWFPILREFFAVVRRVNPKGKERDFTLLQIKEKLGGLRIYYRLGKRVATAAETQIHAAYSAAEARAAGTCEVCGRPGVFRVQGGAWLLTRCEDHAEGGVPAPPSAGM
ncbi:hypothetical protein BPNPMPFG_006296 [Mesorhizobium sp. AR07]|uniref:hypothetical protein n=1 Tax=Mesorhizobium sp. AR07 TaxID=2865838 RepID=UPI00215FB5C3|nr:hypothetical protein [Mesorhizobium sp. AR07]UVK44381.1 hypothetical protein BPNPMPFG_006296 [Mesorhizobium sp. AR07]